MDTHTVSLVIPTNLDSPNLDYYDQLCVTESYCKDTLFAFGSEDYLNVLVSDTKSMPTENSFDFIITTEQEA